MVWWMAAHVFGVILWLGGLTGAALLLGQSAQQSDAALRGGFAQLARKLLRRMADPGAALSIVAGIALLSSNTEYFRQATWLYVKMVNVVLLIGLHGLLAVRVKRQATASVSIEPREATLLCAAVLAAATLILLATFPLRAVAM